MTPTPCGECGAALSYPGARCSFCGAQGERPVRRQSPLRAHSTEFDLWRPELTAQFYKAGFTACEIKLPGCYDKSQLTFAHIDKRRWLTPYELYVMVALACIPCHNTVEHWGREKMRPFIADIIARRGWVPTPLAGITP